ncbi:hypothetical protein L1887_16264 [Cichorium endivia]|nr:hypothetical protein L1887_16264 [Cichorium endivia]
MALIGKVIGYVEISTSGKLLYDLLWHKPHDCSSICPEKVHGCDLESGERGAVGSTIMWHYTHDGKKKYAKELIEEIDETNHKIVLNVIGGEVKETYNYFRLTFHCEEKDGKQYVVWTMEFERPSISVPYPTSVMDYLCGLVKDMDDHHSSRK